MHKPGLVESHAFVAAVLILLSSAPPSKVEASCEWKSLAAPPNVNYGMAMAYDGGRGVTVLFGGQSAYRLLSDTWVWDGSTWKLRSQIGPSPRVGHAMVYDSQRGVIVLFGGYDNQSPLGDTWEWNGATWTLRSTTGPPPTSAHAMAYDGGRGVTVLFTGLSRQTWEWNGTQWVQRFSSQPYARMYASMAYDSGRGKTVLVGGLNSNEDGLYDTWEWDGTTWTLRDGSSPVSYGPLAYDSARQVAVAPRGTDIWEWNGTSWAHRTTITGPSTGSYGVGAVYDSARQVTVIYDGDDGDTRSDTWEFNGTIWSLSPYGSDPSERAYPALAFDSVRGVTVLFGGLTGNALGVLDDTWEWDGVTWTHREVVGPPPRAEHAMAFDSARGVTVLFGGNTGPPDYAPRGDTWEWDGNTWTQRSITGPAPRTFHAMAYDSDRGVTVLYGGSTGGASIDGRVYFGDTWEWDGNTWALRANSGPTPRDGMPMAYDSARHAAILHGGAYFISQGIGTLFDETWSWDGVDWTQRSGVGPSSCYPCEMAFDSVRGVTVLIGGGNSTWEWNGSAWDYRTTWRPRDGAALAFDSRRGVSVLFGENAGDFLANTWEYGAGCPPAVDPKKNRYVSLYLPFPSSTAISEPTAIRIHLDRLQDPDPPNLPQSPPPDFSTFERGPGCTDPAGCVRWVGPPRDYLESPVYYVGGTFRGAHVQCTPYYHDWSIEGRVYVLGAEIVPSSRYLAEQLAASCMGNEDTCTDVSTPVEVETARYGDVASPFSPPSATTQPDVLDVVAAVSKFKGLDGAPIRAIAQLQPNLPELNEEINVLDIVAVVDAVKQFAYPFSGPCPCPSAVPCGPAMGSVACTTSTPCVTAFGSGAMCVMTCSGGDNDGEPCINNTHCPGDPPGTCGNGFCRDRCGRCTP